MFLDIMEYSERKGSIDCIEKSIHIPLGQLRNNLSKLDKNITYITYCAIGIRGYIASRILSQNGFKTKNLAGGLKLYKTMYCKS